MPCTFPIIHTYHFNVKMNDFNKQIWGMKTCLSMTKMCYMLAIHKQESVFKIMVKSVFITVSGVIPRTEIGQHYFIFVFHTGP